MSQTKRQELVISPLETDDQTEQCARMMSASEPWITLRRDYENCLKLLRDSSREVYVGLLGERVIGFIILFPIAGELGKRAKG